MVSTKAFGVFVLVFSAVLAHAQFRVQTLADTTDEWTATFPILSSADHAAAAGKINDHLQKWQFGTTITDGHVPKVQGDEYTCSVVANNARYVSFDINYGYCGCGCHYTFQTASYDSRTGEPIEIGKLVTPGGLTRLRQYLLGDFRKKVKELSATPSNFQEEYRACLDRWKSETGLNFDRWILQDNGIGFQGGSCLDGSNWNADDARMTWSLPFEQLWFALTPYGIELFTGQVASEGSPANLVLHGKVDNKYAINIYLRTTPTGTWSGFSSYDRYGQSIRLDVKKDGNNFVLHELDDKGAALSDIECTWDGKALMGTFRNLKSGKVMPFMASR